MGPFQASMLEAFQSLREELTAKKQTEVDQTSFTASKPGNLVLLLIWTCPLRDLELTYQPRIWMWTTVQHSLLTSYLTLTIHWISTLLHLNYLRKRSRTNPKSHSRSRHEIESRSASVNLLRNPMNLGSLLLNLKSTLIRVNTSLGPDMCHLPQGRISPL